MDDADIRRELSRLADRIQTLDGKVSTLDGRLGKLHKDVGTVGEAVTTLANNVGPGVRRIESALAKLADEMRRDREISAARDARDAIARELKERFGRHEEVRRLADSVIHVVRTGIIDKDVILDAAQRRMVDLPDYWLAPATVAVAAWLSDDEARCTESIAVAMRLDQGKTALFMALLLHQHERGDALQRWIDVYLAGLRPRNLPPHFRVVIDAVTVGELGRGSAPKLMNWMVSSYQLETQSRDVRADAIKQWQQRIASIAATPDFAPTLRTVCPDWAALRERHARNVMVEAADRHIRGRFELGADVPADLSERIRELVMDLAHTYEPQEEKLHRSLRLEDVVVSTGDREAAAKRLSNEDAGRTGGFNILKLVAGSAFPPSADGTMPAPTMSELLSLVMSGTVIADAVDGLYDGTVRPPDVKVYVGRSQTRKCTFDCATDEQVTGEALAAQAAAWQADVVTKIKGEVGAQQAKLKKFLRRPFPAAVASAGVVAAVPFPTGLPVIDFAIPAAAIAGGAGLRLAGLLRRRQEHVQGASVERINDISDALNGAAAELAEFFAAEQRSARLHADLLTFLRNLKPKDAYSALRPRDSQLIPQTRWFPAWTPEPPAGRPELGPSDRRPTVE